jgi:penicillin-binding protein 1A
MSISLGSFGISLAELVQGYGVFANGGQRVKMKAILSVKDRNGKRYEVDEELAAVSPVAQATEPEATSESTNTEAKKEDEWTKNLTPKQVYDPRLAHVMTKLLEGVILYGTGTGAKDVSVNIAGKTGTTNNFVDALFVGYSGSVVTGTWVGFDNNMTLGNGETGGRTALPIWKDIMQIGIAKYGAPEFVAPEGISNIMVNKETGRPLRNGETNGFMETFVDVMDPFSQAAVEEFNEDGTPKPQDALEDGDYYLNQ